MNKAHGITVLMILFGFALIAPNLHANSNYNLNEAFLMAVYENDYAIMEELLKKGADINAVDREGSLTPLAVAAANGDLKLVNFLLENNANPHGNQNIPNLPIYLAISNNHFNVVKKLLELGISPNYAWPNRNGGTLLITAVQMGHLEVIKLLVQLGADVNFCGNGDYSPLYRSIIYDRFTIFKFLISNGAFINDHDLAALSQLKWWKTKNKYIKYLELVNK